MRLGYEYLADKMYAEAVESFIKSNKMIRNPSLILVIANLYDERLNNVSRAISYYRDFLSDHSNSGQVITPDYIESVTKRVEYLKGKQKESTKNIPLSMKDNPKN